MARKSAHKGRDADKQTRSQRIRAALTRKATR
jgi:hypothetical protein